MKFSVFISEPTLGKEIDNVQDILTELGSKNHIYNGLVTSQYSIMGLGAIFYAHLPNFFERQLAAIEHLRKNLKEEQWVLTGYVVFNKQYEYKPLLITQEAVIENSIFQISTPEKILNILTIIDESTPSTDIVIDAVILFKDYIFQTIYTSFPKKISLQYRLCKSDMDLENTLLYYYNIYKTVIVSVPVIGVFNGYIWQGVLGVVTDGRFSLYYYAQKNILHNFIKNNNSHFLLKDVFTNITERIYQSLCYQIKDYISKTRISKVVIAMSGGIDSSVVATLAVKALGASCVMGLLLPGPYSSDHSISDAADLCKRLGIDYKSHNITELYAAFLSLDTDIQSSLTRENLQARIRGVMLMAHSNEQNALALNTCNKSEDAVGYATLYGDAVGAFAPIGDLYKQEVYNLALYINDSFDNLIPANILKKAPSAELKENQKDTDSLPDYKVLDLILCGYLDFCKDPLSLSQELNIEEQEINEVIQKIFRSEYKRKQAPLVVNISSIDGYNKMSSGIWSEKEMWI